MDTRFERILGKVKGFRVNFSSKSKLDNKDGQEGEFRINSHRGRNELYVKLNNKWSRVPLLDEIDQMSLPVPHYDSGWVTVTKGNNTTTYDINHHLGTKMLLVQIYLKDTANSDRIFNVTSDWNDTQAEGSNSTLNFYHQTENKIEICTGDDYLFVYTNTPHSTTAVKLTTADVRLFLWKIPGV